MHTVDFVGLSASWHQKSRIVSTDRLVEISIFTQIYGQNLNRIKIS